MAVKPISLALTCCTLIVSQLPQHGQAAWDCNQDATTGQWVCDGDLSAPEPPLILPPPAARPDQAASPELEPPTEPPTEAAPTAPVAPAEQAREAPQGSQPPRPTPAEEPAVSDPAPTQAETPETTPPETAEPSSEETAKRVEDEAETDRQTVAPPEPAAPTVDDPAETKSMDEGETATSPTPQDTSTVSTPEEARDTAPIPESAPATSDSAEEAPKAPGQAVPEILENEPETGQTTPRPVPPYQPDPARLDAGLGWAYCGPPPRGPGGFELSYRPDPDEPILMEADSAQLFRRENRALLEGNVTAERGRQQLETEVLSYDRDTGKAEASGGALLKQPGLRVLAREVEIDLISRQAHLDQALYRMEGMNARGTADQVHIESQTLSHYTNITYTTCPRDSNAWELRADTLTVDQEQAEAVARDATLRVGGVPILYTPYFSMPLDDRRKSGFLLPSIGHSDRLGLDLSIPYYFNIAPEMDATLIPRYMSERGFMLGGEYRFLTASERGKFYGEYMHRDDAFERSDPRGAFSFQQEGRFGQHWATAVDFNLVSDDNYLEDFGNELSVTSTRHLERRADVYRFGSNWFLLARAQGYQTVDPDIAPQDRPYNRLPQLLHVIEAPNRLAGTDLRLETEYVYFDHGDKVHGNRLALRPSVSLPLRRSYGHLIPKATLHHASYWLQDQTPGLSDSPSLTVPTFSLDGGLVFERTSRWLGESATQTLEPRIFYLYAPHEDQGELPLFDTAELDFSFASLFRDNRFSGRDRVGDANQVTLALTSRTLSDRTGRELFRASLGQIFYFEDRRVQIGSGRADDSTSAMAAELAARFGDDWSGRGGLIWDPNRSDAKVRKSSLGVHYHGPEGRLINLAYRQNEDEGNFDTDFEDTDLSFRLPLDHRWEAVGRWLYSLRHEETMEAFAGVEYKHCCWRVRALVRQFVNSPTEDADLSFMLQFELAGLGAFGDDIQDFLSRGVYGYEVE